MNTRTLLALALLTTFARADVLLPVQDSTSSGASPTSLGKLTTTAGGAGTLAVSRTRNAYVQFDLSKLPGEVQASDITRARLRIYFSRVTKPGDIFVYTYVETPWSESTTASAPLFDLSTVQIPAASVVGKKFVDVNITAFVRSWRQGTVLNNGLVLSARSETGEISAANVVLGAKEGPGSGYPCELVIDYGQRALRLEYVDYAGDVGVNVIGGSSSNSVGSFVYGATIFGGDAFGGNQVTSIFGTVSGGFANTAGNQATVSGGQSNTASGAFSMIPGGEQNTAAGRTSFAAGTRAKANHDGAFCLADVNLNADLTSTAANQFNVRAAGGYRLFSNSAATVGVSLAPNGTAWAVLSDQNAKKNFAPVDVAAVLDRLAEVPVQRWNYKAEPDDAVPHLGPMAQAFKAAFYPGRDDTVITTLEFDGVELAAIQGLHAKLKQKDAEIAALKAQLAATDARLTRLETLLPPAPGKAVQAMRKKNYAP